MATAATFDGIDYTTSATYAPCYGANHNHSRRIGTCLTCGAAVVLYQGRILDVPVQGVHAVRKFTCWADSHDCTAVLNAARYQALRSELREAFHIADEAYERGDDESYRVLRANVKALRTAFVAFAEQTGQPKAW